jgi:hypothetical protein
MVNSLKPLFKRQMPVKSHFSSSFECSIKSVSILPSQNFRAVI